MKKENKTSLNYLLFIVAIVTVTTLTLCYWEWDLLAILFAVPSFTLFVLSLFIKIPYTPPKKKTPEQVAREVWAALF